MTTQPELKQRLVRVLRSAQGECIFVRQKGSLGHYGHVILVVEPSPDDGLTLEWAVNEATIPERFSKAVQRGIQLTCSAKNPDVVSCWVDGGPFQGCAFTRTKVRIIDGSYHDYDSSEHSFEIAGSVAFSNAVKNAGGPHE
jgi:elongation factor G